MCGIKKISAYFLLALLSACACTSPKTDSTTTMTVEPGGTFTGIKSFYVLSHQNDSFKIERLITEQMLKHGYAKSDQRDAAGMLIEYQAESRYVMTGSLLFIPVGYRFLEELHLVFRETKTAYPLISASFEQDYSSFYNNTEEPAVVVARLISDVMEKSHD